MYIYIIPSIVILLLSKYFYRTCNKRTFLPRTKTTIHPITKYKSIITAKDQHNIGKVFPLSYQR